MSATLKFLIIFGVVYVALKAYLFYRLNKAMRSMGNKLATEKAPSTGTDPSRGDDRPGV